MYVKKGSRISARWFGDAKAVALAGVNMKLQVTEYAVSGIVRHVRGDDPVNPTTIRFYIDPDPGYDGPRARPPGCACSQDHVEINPDHVIPSG